MPRPRAHTAFATGDGHSLRLSNAGQLELLRAVLERQAALRTRVRGGSMAPFIRDGDIITIAPLGITPLRPGDVVAIALPQDGRLVIHRIVAAGGGGWVVRGDNNPQADACVDGEDVLGRVVRVERAGRDVRAGLGSDGTMIALLNRGPALGWARAGHRATRRAAAQALRLIQGLRGNEAAR